MTTSVTSRMNESVTAVAKRITKDLRQQADPQRAKSSLRFFKENGQVVLLGLETAALRKYIKNQTKTLKQTWTLQQAITCCDQLLQAKELEIRAAGTLVLSVFKKQFTMELADRATKWLKTRLDNWALVDGFCSEVLCPLLALHTELEDTLKTWSQDRILWVRRAALVTLVSDARKGQKLDLVYALASEHLSDPEDLMHKASGWLLREAGKTDMKRLRQFLLKHGPTIPRTALRYAIEKFPAQERKELLAKTSG